MATENIMMDAVKNGGDRQELHERIREHSMAAARRIKEEGLENDLLGRIENDPAFKLQPGQLDNILEPSRYVGRAPQQTEEFFKNYVDPILKNHPEAMEITADINV